MIDIHCHILPGIDDGAKDMVEALALINLAVEDGVTRIVVTPHLHFGRFDNYLPVIESSFLSLQQEVIKEKIQIELAYAAEVRLDSEILSYFLVSNYLYMAVIIINSLCCLSFLIVIFLPEVMC